ncbi:phosphoprotein phosphatase [Schizosaccharomyces japonicus yFS275]|uniref:Very-long-chain (3R)-3-hydroxyacyl-CoA dehydratase n=1 Tax=Schizosaccharomyces japonicus (strain yFS275 / FY16936) TaxID=402676 RepID=B6K0A7_SCHJY|nr:phosphoprotein phosphatase [Schizosaccharomyces japonicus yFS275]EEB06257.1 phosphoprotein phosphatase [Schizosaccharomyces japonicus yFS275]
MAKPGVDQYLKLYNVLSSFLWMSVLTRGLLLWYIIGDYRAVFLGTESFVRWVQTLAIAEVVHCMIGFVRSSVVTTAIQVASRVLLVWGVCYPFPEVVRDSPIYLSMIFAWSVTEVIRYTFYACNLAKNVPATLLWLRYSAFIVLYPIGAGSEFLLVLKTLRTAVSSWFPNKIIWPLILVIYPPGLWHMYTYMLSQRRKAMNASAKK